MQSLFEKNLSTLIELNPLLTAKLMQVYENSEFEVFQGKDLTEINIINKKTFKSLYDKPSKEIMEKITALQPKATYPFLYFFGLGNGLLYKLLLSNQTFERLIVIEPELEIIYIVLNLIDFTEEFRQKRLVILLSEDMDFTEAVFIVDEKNAKLYSRLFEIDVSLPYYFSYKNELLRVSELLTRAITYTVISHGNDAVDTLIGVQHFIANLPEMIENYPLSSIRNQKNSDLVIIVSTGPSLAKQLPLLKKYQHKATIISVDASLPILEQWGIQPDIVTSIERVELTAKFYEETSTEFQKNSIFVIASLAHSRLLNALKEGKKIIAMRPFQYAKFFDLKDYGYLGIGMSAAHTAFELAYLMKYKRVVLIGQDLAFSENGQSHSDGHVYGKTEIAYKETDGSVERYGGNGKIRTTLVWNMFRDFFETSIGDTYGEWEVINATEGGARIHGAIESSFKSVCDVYLSDFPNKIPMQINKLSTEQQSIYREQARIKTNEFLKSSYRYQKKIEKLFLEVAFFSDTLIQLNNENRLENVNFVQAQKIIDKIETIKALFEDPKFKKLFMEITLPYLIHQEMDLADIIVKPVTDEKSKQAKQIEWIMRHREWLFSLAGSIDSLRVAIKRGKKEWKSRGF